MKAFCKLLKLPELVGAGTSPAVAAVLDLAISANACKTLDVSGAGVALVLPLRGMKSLGGEPVGVVDRGATDERNIRIWMHFSKDFFFPFHKNNKRAGSLSYRFEGVRSIFA